MREAFWQCTDSNELRIHTPGFNNNNNNNNKYNYNIFLMVKGKKKKERKVEGGRVGSTSYNYLRCTYMAMHEKLLILFSRYLNDKNTPHIMAGDLCKIRGRVV